VRAAEESNRSRCVVEVVSEPQVPALPEPGPQLEVCDMGIDSRGKRGREGVLTSGTITTSPDRAANIVSLTRTLCYEYERRGPFSQQYRDTVLALDSLAGRGAARMVMEDYENRIRSGLIERFT